MIRSKTNKYTPYSSYITYEYIDDDEKGRKGDYGKVSQQAG